jgi:hypothetical protein
VTATELGKKLTKTTRHPVRTMFDNREAGDLSDEDYERIAQALEDIVKVLGADEEPGEKPLDAIGPVDATR